ncbi:MAG TPA: Fe-S protein assembly co-chaperone HscB [Methylomirabilota bacterium]|jgi:molecular chaperone HscB
MGALATIMDYFEVFGLPRRLGIDAQTLQRRFYELSRRYHPDFHAGAPREEQARTLEASARLNAAYRALRDPIARIEYLVQLEEGRQTREGATVKPQAPAELLAEMFEIQEALDETRAGDLAETARETLRAQRERLMARRREEGVRLTGPLAAAWDAAGPGERSALLEELKRALAARAYLQTVIDDLAQALGDDEAP